MHTFSTHNIKSSAACEKLLSTVTITPEKIVILTVYYVHYTILRYNIIVESNGEGKKS